MKQLPSTIAADGEHVDCYIGPNLDDAKSVYIVHQHIAGEYDEDKCFIGFDSAEDAQQCYRDHMSLPDALHSMTILPVDEFIEKVKATRQAPGKIHASELLNRELKPHEKKHDFEGHAKRQDSTQTAIRRILGGAKPGLIREAAQRAAQFEPQHLDEMKMPFDRSLVARIAKSVSIAHKFGFDQVYAERYRATKRPKTQKAALSTPAPAQAKKSSEQDKPGLIAEAAISDLNNWLTARARGAHIDNWKKGLQEDDLVDSIIDSLDDGSDSQLDRIAMEAARSAVTGGRYDAFQDLASEIDRYARSEAMDQNTCEECAAGDGAEWDSLDDVDWSPGDDCEGGDACRGQLMPIFADEGETELG